MSVSPPSTGYESNSGKPLLPAQQGTGSASDASSTTPAGGWLAIAGGLLIAVGTFLPWMTFGLGTISRNGFQLGANDALTAAGPVLAILGIVTVIIGITRLTGTVMPSWLQRSTIVSGLAAGVVVAVNWSGIHQVVENAQGSGISAAIGYGYWVCALGAVVAVAAGFVLRSDN